MSTLVVLGYDEKLINQTIDKVDWEPGYEVSDVVATLIKLMAGDENERQLPA